MPYKLKDPGIKAEYIGQVTLSDGMPALVVKTSYIKAQAAIQTIYGITTLNRAPENYLPTLSMEEIIIGIIHAIQNLKRQMDY